MNQEIQAEQQIPWNKGKLIGQKSPLKLKEIWAIRIRLQKARNTRELHCSILPLIGSFGDAIWSSLKSAILDKMAEYHFAQSSCSRKLRSRFNLRLPNKPGTRWQTGLAKLN